jgi:predicted short-subunit dehydrogenase-like oxidoreductase (DUF2520 family)
MVIVGAGRAGTGIGLALAAAGFPTGFLSRRPVPVIGDSPAWRSTDPAAPRSPAIYFLAVPDARIVEVATDLIAKGFLGEGSMVGHLSGALPASVLSPVTGDLPLFSAHPLLAFPPPNPPRPMPAGTTVMVEGQPEALAAVTPALKKAGAAVAPIRPEKKALYHAAAVLCSNMPAALMWAAAELFAECGVPQPVAASARLMGSLASNVAQAPFGSTVTGPFSRGDGATISANIEALRAANPGVADLYLRLGARLADLLRDGRILSERTWKETKERLV